MILWDELLKARILCQGSTVWKPTIRIFLIVRAGLPTTCIKHTFLPSRSGSCMSLHLLGFIASYVNVFIVFFVTRDAAHHWFILPWLIAVVMITTFRAGLVFWFRSSKLEPSTAPIWLKRFLCRPDPHRHRLGNHSFTAFFPILSGTSGVHRICAREAWRQGHLQHFRR